jgi:indolepyruvate ferredoxin oxidoreductase beta subunit
MEMTSALRQQILISGVGGQGVLFVTRLLAEAAILRGFPVFTCETHGMAQRGGTVVSHLKVGDFHSPLIRAGQADGLLVLKAENLAQHGLFLKTGGWAVVNAGAKETLNVAGTVFCVDADELVRKSGDAKSLNLVLLGFALAVAEKKMPKRPGRLFCRLADIEKLLGGRINKRGQPAVSPLKAVRAGYEALTALGPAEA